MTVETSEAVQALTADEARDLLARASRAPSLRRKYAEQLAADAPVWSELPALTKGELNDALEELRTLDPRQRGGAYYYASGGTMSEPRLSLIPGEMFIADILAQWQPLTPDDVLVNLFTPGRLWSAHYFYNAVAVQLGAAVVPFGGLEDHELDQWLDFFDAQGATAYAATPTTLKQIIGHCATTGRAMPRIRKLLWVGEKYDDLTAELVAEHLPDAEVWGLYGSSETWVIGWNTPRCPTDTVHPLPYQRVETEDDVILVTNTHPTCVNPLLRYRVGDLGVFTTCRCGRDGVALRVLGRADSYFKFLNQLISPEELIGLAKELPDVRDAQIVLVAPGTDAERLQIRVKPTAAPKPGLRERVRKHVLAGHFELGYVVSDSSAAVEVDVVSHLTSNSRTGKTPMMITEPAP